MKPHQPRSQPTATGRRRVPAMVLVERYVEFDDQVYGFIKESAEFDDVEEFTGRALDDKGIIDKKEREMALGAELARYRSEVQVAAFEALMRSSRRPTGVRKEPLPSSCNDGYDDDYYRDLLDGTDLCFSQVAGVTFLSLKRAWPPSRCEALYPGGAFISSCHKGLLLVSLGSCSLPSPGPGFYMVYNTPANSLAIVPPIASSRRVSFRSHYHITRSGGATLAAILCLGEHHDYLVADLFLRADHLKNAPGTSRATLMLWRSLSPEWISTEVELPFSFSFFRADMVFAVGHTALCWVDLCKGVLVYNHYSPAGRNPFHFIALPIHPSTGRKFEPQEYRSICCINDNTLQFVSMEGYTELDDQPMAEVKLKLWSLNNPLSDETKSRWRCLHTVRMGEFWKNPKYDGLPWMPSNPVISTQQPHVIYLSVHNYEYNREHEVMEATELYVLGIDMRRKCVVSAFKGPYHQNGRPMLFLTLFTCHFTSYLNQTRDDLYKVCPRGKEAADEGGSRGNRAKWTSVWIADERGVSAGGLEPRAPPVWIP